MRNEYAFMEFDNFFVFFFFQVSCFFAGRFLSYFFNNRLFTCLLLVLRVHKVGVTVKQVFKQFLHDCVIWLDIIITNGFIVCNNCVLLNLFASVTAASVQQKKK